VRRGEVSAVSLVEKSLSRFKEKNDVLNAVIEWNEDASLAQAAVVDKHVKEGSSVVDDDSHAVLLGSCVSIKDNFMVKGYKTTAGSHMLHNLDSTYDAAVVERIRGHHGIPCAKSNMDEFGMGSSTSKSVHGPTLSPYSYKGVALTAGGSSGGAAAAVAAGFVSTAIGSDTGGSVRQPSSFCGLVGIKPTYGSFSRHGLLSYASSMDCPGVLANSVTDAVLMFDVLVGADQRDATCLPAGACPPVFKWMLSSLEGKGGERGGGGEGVPTLADLTRMQSLMSDGTAGEVAVTRHLCGTTIGVPDEFVLDELDPAVKSSLLKAIRLAEGAGATVRRVSIPALKVALPTYYVLACAEASSNLLRYDGIRYGHRTDRVDPPTTAAGVGDEEYSTTTTTSSMTALHTMIARTRGEAFGPEVVRRILTGTFVLSESQRAMYLETASRVRVQLVGEVQAALTSVDALLFPTVPAPAFPLSSPPSSSGSLVYDLMTVPANLVGAPAISIPVGEDEGRPIGIQIMTGQCQERTMFATALALEHLFTRDRERDSN